MRLALFPGGLAFLLSLGAWALAGEGAGETRVESLDLFDAASPDGARAAWQPMVGTAPVSLAKAKNRIALKMPCNFRGTRFDRASWDRTRTLDLRDAVGLRFQCTCPDISPVARFSIYFESGKGWYAGSFSPPGKAAWGTVTVKKCETGIEGDPKGWGKITRIRISAWRGADKDTVLYLARAERISVLAPVAVVRGESGARASSEERKSVCTFAERAAGNLERVGAGSRFLSDLDLPGMPLKGVRLLILPHNPSMPDKVCKRIIRFLEEGGKLLAFYSLPSALRPIAGVEGGRYVRQAYPGHFSFLRLTPGVLRGAPARVKQRSWNILDYRAREGRSRVAAVWLNEKGEPTGHAALLVSRNCILMTHVLLPDDPEKKRRLLLAMVGHFVPEVWKTAVAKSLDRIGAFGPFAGFAEAEREILRECGEDEEDRERVSRAKALRDRAQKMASEGNFEEALKTSERARAALIAAYCATRKSREGEHRAFWCHSAFGVQGMTWDEAIRLLSENGFTAILPNMLWGGVAFFDSKVLPVAPEVKERGDQIRLCLEACRKYGIACHVWKVNWNMGSRTPSAFKDRMHKAGRTQVSFEGKAQPRWLCPSHPDNQSLEIEAMLEVARRYDVAGIHFDYIRYPGSQHCYCSTCRERFEGILGTRIVKWPQALRGDRAMMERWLAFRRGNITKVVEAVSRAARKAKPGIRISAAVFANWAGDRDRIGQDWKLWCEKGYLDFVCPMDYTADNARFENWVALQRKWAGPVPCYPGIGLSTWRGSDGVCRVIDQIGITRGLKTGGFTVFELGEREVQEVLPLLGLGITRKP
ncbi:MAG: glycoside hydrolase family 10 protein [Planctomycetota bacterium]|jgi:uncharacterized lipoprotein YddW (UPF0748 family)